MSETVYYCKAFVAGKCKKKSACTFVHPREISNNVLEQTTRKLGFCYCGTPQRKIVSKDIEKPFFVACGKTGRSMRRCKQF